MSSPTLLTGGAGEHLVCLDVRYQGYIAFLAPQDCAYDLALDSGKRLLRVQVKTTIQCRLSSKTHSLHSWHFNLRRRGLSLYKDTDYDILALAGLDIKKVAYVLPAGRSEFSIRDSSNKHMESKFGRKGVYFDDLTLEKVLAELGEL